MYVCVCNAVTEDDVNGCMSEGGCRTTRDVKAACGMRPGCGSCTKRISSMVSQYRTASDLVDALTGGPALPRAVPDLQPDLEPAAQTPDEPVTAPATIPVAAPAPVRIAAPAASRWLASPVTATGGPHTTGRSSASSTAA